MLPLPLADDIHIAFTISDVAATVVAGGVGGAIGAVGRLFFSYLKTVREDHKADRDEIKALTVKIIEMAVGSATAVTSTGKAVQEAVQRQVDLHNDVRILMQSNRDVKAGVKRLLKQESEDDEDANHVNDPRLPR